MLKNIVDENKIGAVLTYDNTITNEDNPETMGNSGFNSVIFIGDPYKAEQTAVKYIFNLFDKQAYDGQISNCFVVRNQIEPDVNSIRVVEVNPTPVSLEELKTRDDT